VTSYGSLTLSGSGYTIGGTTGITFTSIDSSQSSSSNTVSLPIDLSGATTVTVDTSGASLVLGGVVSGSAGLTKAGSGGLDLTQANTYTGTTAVQAGTLLVDGAQGTSPVTIVTGSTLGGIGTVGSITAAGGTLSPGDSGPGLLTDTGTLTLGADASSHDSVFSVQLDAGSTPGTDYSQLQVTGQINLSGVNLNLTLGSGFVATANQTYTILDNTGSSAITGTFAGLAEGSNIVVSGVSFRVSYVGGTNKDSVVLTELASSSTTVSATPTSAVYGQAVSLQATVTGTSGGATPTGTVEFLNGTTSLGTQTLSSGVATLAVTSLPVATNSITAVYQGDTNYGSSTSTPAVTVTVAKASTTSTVTFSPSTPVFGQSVTLTATIAAVSPGVGTPTGTVTFFNNGTTSLGTGTLNSSGVATLADSTLPVAANSITATYGGDTNFSTITSTAVTVTVAKASTTATVTSSVSSPTPFEAVTLTATIAAVSPGAGTPTGTVTFFDGTTSLGTGTLNSSGVATFAVSSVPVGSYSITAQYGGDTNFTGSTSTAVTAVVGTANEQWLNAVYEIELNRPLSQSDLQAWDKQFADGRSRKSIAYEIANSLEGKQTIVQNAFQQYLGRAASSTEVTNVMLAAESTHTSVRAIILGSREYFDKSGGTIQSYVSALETAVLGTTVNPGYLESQLEKGVLPATVAEEVLLSNRGQAALLSSSFQTVLSRAPSAQDTVYYVGLMDQGVYLRDIQAALLASAEFYNDVVVSTTSSS